MQLYFCKFTYFSFLVFQKGLRMFCEVCSLPVICVQHISIYYYLSSLSPIFTSEMWFVLMTVNCKGIVLSSVKMETRKFIGFALDAAKVLQLLVKNY
jgi:hypothetical protein